MNYQCVVIPVAVCLLLDILAVLAPFTSKPICLAWNTSHSHLSVECFIRDATNDLSIVDPSGIYRVQCILGISPHCWKSYKADLFFEQFSKPLTTMMLTTTKYQSEGEWKCRHGKEETKSNVSYTEGTDSKIEVEIFGKVRTVNKRNIFELTCFSCTKPHIQGVDIYIDNVLEDSIRYNNGLCYHKRNQCTSSSCTCLAEGREFTWKFISDLSHLQFKCEMRFRKGVKSPIYIHEAELIYDGAVFIKAQKKNTSLVLTESKTPNKTSNNADKEGDNSGHITYPVLGVVGLIIMITLILCVLRVYGLKKKKADANDEERQLEEVSLLDANNEERQLEEVSLLAKHTTEVSTEKFQNQKASEKTTHLPSTVTGRTNGNEDIKIVCMCSNQYQEKKYTNNIIQKLYKFGFRPENIKFVYNALPDNFLLETLQMALNLIIVLPKGSVFNNESFIKLVESAVRLFKENRSAKLFPIVRSTTTLPLCLINMMCFSNIESALKNALKQCSFEEKMNELTSSSINLRQINFKQNRLNTLILSPNAHEYFELFQILKGWGVEVVQNRISFHMKALQSQSRYEPTCLHDVVSCLLKGKSLKFLKMYDVATFDLRDLKLHTHMYSQLIKIFETINGMKEGKWWYHYRRSGLSYISPSEAAFKPMKRVFLDKNVAAIFKQFKTTESRLNTFKDYPIENKAYREKLSLAGFFYCHVSDYVQCFNCGGCLRAWNSMCDPIKRHTETFKTCHFACDTKWKESSNMDAEPATYESMHTQTGRLRSFETFPGTLSRGDVELLAQAGFYYYGIAQDIVCSACYIEFASVENSEYILRLHKIYSGQCPNITKFKTHAMTSGYFDEESISNFVPYLELEYRKHNF